MLANMMITTLELISKVNRLFEGEPNCMEVQTSGGYN